MFLAVRVAPVTVAPFLSSRRENETVGGGVCLDPLRVGMDHVTGSAHHRFDHMTAPPDSVAPGPESSWVQEFEGHRDAETRKW